MKLQSVLQITVPLTSLDSNICLSDLPSSIINGFRQHINTTLIQQLNHDKNFKRKFLLFLKCFLPYHCSLAFNPHCHELLLHPIKTIRNIYNLCCFPLFIIVIISMGKKRHFGPYDTMTETLTTGPFSLFSNFPTQCIM